MIVAQELHFGLALRRSIHRKRGTDMAEDKRNRDQEQGGNQSSQDRKRRDRKPSGGSMESPDSSRTRREDEEEPQE